MQHRVQGEWRPVHSMSRDYTDHLGRYALSIPAGTYRVEYDHLDHLVQHVDGVVVRAGETVVRDVVLERGSAIQGRVTAPSDGPAYSAFVRVFQKPVGARPGPSGWHQVDYTFVGVTGDYSVGGLAPGTYRLSVQTVDDVYRERFYLDVPGVGRARDLVLRRPDQTISGIDFDLGAPFAKPDEKQRKSVRFGRAPALKGKPRVGRVLRVRHGKVRPAGATVRYRWHAGPRRVRTTRVPRLRLTRAFAGRRVKVVVVARAAGHQRARVRLRTGRKVARR